MSQRFTTVLHSLQDSDLAFHGYMLWCDEERVDEAPDYDADDEYLDRLEREQLEAVESAGGWGNLLHKQFVLETSPYIRKNWMVDRAKLGFENTRRLFARKTYISWVRFLKIRTKRFCYPF